MISKLKVYERCERCGLRDATRRGDFVYEYHTCESAPPGPSNRPRTFHIAHIDLIPGDWTADELLYQLKHANDEIGMLRQERLSYKTIIGDVERALGKKGGWQSGR